MTTWGCQDGCGGAWVLDVIFGCVLLLDTRSYPSLLLTSRTEPFLDRLSWILVGIVEVTDSESDSTRVKKAVSRGTRR